MENEQRLAKCMALVRCRKERHAENKHHKGKIADVDTRSQRSETKCPS